MYMVYPYTLAAFFSLGFFSEHLFPIDFNWYEVKESKSQPHSYTSPICHPTHLNSHIY